MRSVIVLAIVTGFIAFQAKTEVLKPGDKRPLFAPKGGWIPLVTDDANYGRFATAVQGKSLKALKSLAAGKDCSLTFARPGRQVEVVSVHEERDPTSKAFLPWAEVRSADKQELRPEFAPAATFRVPLASLRAEDDPSLPGETPLPFFELIPLYPPVIARPGMEMCLFGDGLVPVTTDVTTFDEWVKLYSAGDRLGAEKLEKAGRLIWIPSVTRVLILESEKNQFIGKGRQWVEARILEGPLKGEKVVASESRAWFVDLKVTAVAKKAAMQKRNAAK